MNSARHFHSRTVPRLRAPKSRSDRADSPPVPNRIRVLGADLSPDKRMRIRQSLGINLKRLQTLSSG